MSEDIMSVFKNQTFFVVPNEYEDFHQHLIVLCDITYWNTHYETLKDWCDSNGCEVMGMTVNVPNDQALTLFLLRWQ